MNNKVIDGISEDVLDILTDYQWPGNVRELKNVIERAVVLTQDRIITQKDLPQNISKERIEDRKLTIPFGMTLREIEKKIIIETLRRSKGDKEITANLLGITPRTIYRKMDSLEEEEKQEEGKKQEKQNQEEEKQEEAKKQEKQDQE